MVLARFQTWRSPPKASRCCGTPPLSSPTSHCCLSAQTQTPWREQLGLCRTWLPAAGRWGLGAAPKPVTRKGICARLLKFQWVPESVVKARNLSTRQNNNPNSCPSGCFVPHSVILSYFLMHECTDYVKSTQNPKDDVWINA